MQAPLRWIDGDAPTFREKFDRDGFTFDHRLTNHPLFELDRLIELAKVLSTVPDRIVYDAGTVRVDQRWDEVPVCSLPVHTLIENIATAGAWILLKHADKYPGYSELLDECVRDVEALAERDLDRTMKARKAIVFLNSPNRVTSYHIDHQCTFLLQIRGSKTISIFDPSDRDVLPETELEAFWARDDNAAVYKQQFQDRARTFTLQPGMGVHIPVNAPHWVQNGPEISVSLNFNFDLHEHVLGDIYRSNYWLRKLGFDPVPPRRSAARDALKAAMFASARSVRGLVRPRR